MKQGHRQFHNLPSLPPKELLDETNSLGNVDTSPTEQATLEEKLLNYINEGIIGHNQTLKSPFGDRKIVYCDYTASGRSLSFIEKFINKNVLPDYGNVHTTSTATSLQTTLYRHEARNIIRNATRAGVRDAVMFVSSGCTGAIHKLIHNLKLKEEAVVFVGPFEHHSNLLPWRHVGAECIRIRATAEGEVDLEHLEEELKKRKGSKRPLIGTFSAASNVTGIISDVNRIAILLHRYGAKAFFDYASAAPYLPIDMNPVVVEPGMELAYKDAVFFSMHKFVGGVQTPGVLIAKRDLFKDQSIPHEAGGGTVFFVRRDNELYLRDVEYREEGGTPAIVESIRAGMVMQLKEAVTTEVIQAKEEEYSKLAWETWSRCPQLVVFGSSKLRRLPIFSFLVRIDCAGKALFLHHNFVSTLLNDVFGIQSRSGCACAGPYAQDLLGIDEKSAADFERNLFGSGLHKYHLFPHREILRPGFTRISLPYFMPRSDVQFILKAVEWVAANGWRLLPFYRFHSELGEWRFKGEDQLRGRRWLSTINYHSGQMNWREPRQKSELSGASSPEDCFRSVEIFLEKKMNFSNLPDDRNAFDEESQKLRWFLLPTEAAELLDGKVPSIEHSPPIQPGKILPAASLTRRVTTDALETVPKALALESAFDVSTDASYQHAASSPISTLSSDTSTGQMTSPSPPSARTSETSTGQMTSPSPPSARTSETSTGQMTSPPSVIVSETSTGQMTSASSSFDMIQSSLKSLNISPALNSSASSVNVSSDDSVKSENHSPAVSLPSNEHNLQNSKVSSVRRDITTGIWKGQSNQSHVSVDSSHSSAVMSTTREFEAASEEPSVEIVDSMVVSHDGPLELAPLKTPPPVDFLSTHQMPFSIFVASDSEVTLHSSNPSSDNLIFDNPNNHVRSATVPTHGISPLQNNSTSSHKSVSCTDKSTDQYTARSASPNSGFPEPHPIPSISQVFPIKTSHDSTNVSSDRVCSLACDRTEEMPVVNRESKSAIKAIAADDHPKLVGKQKKRLWRLPPKEIMNPFLEAVETFKMIENGDRVIVCLSGGKDSLSLLHTMRQYQFSARSKGISFELAAATVDPLTPSFDPKPLKPYVQSLGIPYFLEEQNIMQTAEQLPYECDSICAFCSRMKRGRLYACARREKYNVLAMGQHLDDLTESLLMSFFYNGALRTMKANYRVEDGDLRVIRPFVFVREKHTRKFANSAQLPIIPENCPACFEAPQERFKIKQMMTDQELKHPSIYNSIKSALKPYMALQREEKLTKFRDTPEDVCGVGLCLSKS